jgi:hypothetical protein
VDEERGIEREGRGASLRSGDDDFGVDQLLVKLGVGALLVRRGHQRVALVLEPLADAELVLGGAEEGGDLD